MAATTDPIRAALERLVELDDGCTADHWHAAVEAARAALAAEPEGEPSDEELLESAAKALGYKSIPSDETCLTAEAGEILAYARAVLARWSRPAAPLAPDHESLIGLAFGREPWATWLKPGGCLESAYFELADLMLAALARWGRSAAPPAPLEGEVGELVEFLDALAKGILTAAYTDKARRAATLIQQLAAAAPAVVPVAVSERPWEREGWRDEQGRCWLQGKVEGDWRLLDPINSGVPQLRYCFSHSLPAHAIPLPAPQGGEV